MGARCGSGGPDERQRSDPGAGFTFEGTARNAGVVHGARVDLAVYSLIPADLYP